MDRDRDFKAVYLERAGDGPAMLKDGRVAALWGGGIGWPGFTRRRRCPAARASSRPNNAEIDRILAKHRFLKPVTIPAGSYPPRNASTFPRSARGASSSRAPTFRTRPRIASRARWHRGEGKLGARLAQARDSTAQNTWSAVADRELLPPRRAQIPARRGHRA
jgi:hypothetical protein